MKHFLFAFLILTVTKTMGQTAGPVDSLPAAKTLDSITITAFQKQGIIQQLPDIKGTYIFSGKKSSAINLSQTPASLPLKIARQVFASVPGVFVYDMDGSGNQINIATRGLDPHRGWEFNNRKDGTLINSDMYGYPASHFSMPLESIERIELVRGTGSLQYGAQFGGMLNYITKEADSNAFSFEGINTTGSYHLVSTYNAIGGNLGKLKYYAYMSYKSKDGFRKEENTRSEAQSLALTYAPNARLSVKFDWSRSAYLYKMPGQLNDSMFRADPRQATRNRNYFNPDIHVPSINLNWIASPTTKWQFITSAVLGKRNSIMYDKPANVKDSINPTTLQYSNRQVDIDQFNSYTAELRLLQDYRLGKQASNLAAGIQVMHNDLHRRQMGKGSTGTDFNLQLVSPGWGRDLHLKTRNIAVFVENRFQLLKNLSWNAGARMELGRTDMSGQIVYYPENKIPVQIKHSFPLLGTSFSFKPTRYLELYGGASQAYRPMLFKDIIPASVYEKVDPNIKDARGYNAELGARGNWKFLKWDVSAFLLKYINRFGTIAQTGNQGGLYIYRTNIGNSLSAGAEIFVQGDWMIGPRTGLTIFTSTAFNHARYTSGMLKSGNNNIPIKGKKIESVPGLISRNGLVLRYHKFNASVLYSYTSETYADALNTEQPSPGTGAVGKVPAYGILDLTLGYRLNKSLEARLNIANLTDQQYFTKRPAFYPGPGIWPSDGRNFCFTIMIRI